MSYLLKLLNAIICSNIHIIRVKITYFIDLSENNFLNLSKIAIKHGIHIMGKIPIKLRIPK